MKEEVYKNKYNFIGAIQGCTNCYIIDDKCKECIEETCVVEEPEVDELSWDRRTEWDKNSTWFTLDRHKLYCCQDEVIKFQFDQRPCYSHPYPKICKQHEKYSYYYLIFQFIEIGIFVLSILLIIIVKMNVLINIRIIIYQTIS